VFLDWTGKDCQGQALLLIKKFVHYRPKSFITLAPEDNVTNYFCIVAVAK
jgi:hypothetical protein